MEMIYEYISGAEFRQRIEAIVEPFMEMRKDLHREQIAMQKLWTKREKQIDRVLLGAAGMHGDLEGIVGAQLPGGKDAGAASERTRDTRPARGWRLF